MNIAQKMVAKDLIKLHFHKSANGYPPRTHCSLTHTLTHKLTHTLTHILIHPHLPTEVYTRVAHFGNLFSSLHIKVLYRSE